MISSLKFFSNEDGLLFDGSKELHNTPIALPGDIVVINGKFWKVSNRLFELDRFKNWHVQVLLEPMSFMTKFETRG